MRSLLLVSDVQTERVLRDVFARHGNDIQQVSDATELLERCNSDSFALIVVDERVLGLDLVDVLSRGCSQIHGQTSFVVILTEDTRSVHVARLLEAGADDCLPLPLDAMALETRVLVARRRYAEQERCRQVEASLWLRERAIAAANSSIVIADAGKPDYPIDFVTPAFERLTGYSAAEVVGRNARFLQGAETDTAEKEALRRAIAEGREHTAMLVNYRKEGTPFWNELYVSPLCDNAGTVTHYVGVQRDVTERRRIEEQLLQQAFHDPLTGLPNRLLFRDRLEHAVRAAMRRQDLVAVLFLDLDGFKAVNDTLGHLAGDQLLIAVAERLGVCLRTSDTAARFGGDEFTVLLEELSDGQDAIRVAERILERVAQGYSIEGQSVSVTTSIGVAYAPGPAARPDDLLKQADGVLYQAKAGGKNRYAVVELRSN